MKTMNSTEMYQVVMNLDNELSIWPECKVLPVGWRSIRVSGCKQECLDYIIEMHTQSACCDLPAMKPMCPTQDPGCCSESTN